LQDDGVGRTHFPPMQVAGDSQPGPLLASQLPKSAAGATHVVDVPPFFGQVPLFEQVVKTLAMRPHGCPTAARPSCVQEPAVTLEQ
jgi:hypothetical protein